MPTIVEYIIELKDKLSSGIKHADDNVKKLNNSTNQLRSTVQSLGLAFGAMEAISFGKSVIQTTADMQSLNRAITFMSTDGAQTLEFLKQTTNSLGTSIQATSEGYKSFLGSMRGKIPDNEIQKMFKQFSIGAAAMGLSIDQQQGMFIALSQMASKGNVQAEELRGQLSERLPGAFGLMAKSLGVTEQKLNKMLEQGQVLAKDALPKLANEIEKTFKGAVPGAKEGLQARLTELQNAILQIKMNLGAAFDKEIKAGIKQLKEWFNWINRNIDTIKKWINITITIVKWILIYKVALMATNLILKAARIATIAYNTALTALNGGFQTSAESVKKFGQAIKSNVIAIAITSIVALISKLKELKEESTKASEKWLEYKNKLLENRDLISKFSFFPKMRPQEQFAYMDEIANRIDELKGKMAEYEYNTKFTAATYDAFVKKHGNLQTSALHMLSPLNKEYRRLIKEAGGAEDIEWTAKQTIKQFEEIYKKMGVLMSGKKRPDIGISAVPSDELKQTITGAAPKVFNINVTKLVETLIFKSEQMSEPAKRDDIRKAITDVLMEALVDVQNIARA